MRDNIIPGAEVDTDKISRYRTISEDYAHRVIDRLGRVRRFAARFTLQGIENFWSCLKRGLGGTYVQLSHFICFGMWTSRLSGLTTAKNEGGKFLKDSERFELALSQIAGKRLTFAEVTGKVGETSFLNPYRLKRGRKAASAAVSALASGRRVEP